MNKVILIGNPNTGKTTLFNTITSSHEHAGNWHGVTVGAKSKDFKFQGEKYNLVDLPGLYSIDTYSEEERIACDYLMQNKDSVVINICDANHIERNLLLTLQLKNITQNIVVAVNMAKENKLLDFEKLSREIGLPVVPIDARKRKSVSLLLSAVSSMFLSEAKTNKACRVIQGITKNTEEQFQTIREIMRKVCGSGSQKIGLGAIDKILTNRVLFLPFFVLVMGFVFFVTFGPPGAFLSEKIAVMSDVIAENVLGFVESKMGVGVLYGFLSRAVFGGIASVLGFLPQVGLLFFCLGFLEDIGYLPRVAYMLDGVLKKVGLTGRALFSLLMGFGCTTTAMMTTRNLDNQKLKKRTAFILPFMSCSAKLPIFLVVASAFFEKHKVLAILGLYLLSIVIAIVVSSVSSKINKEESNYFIMELPKYRMPSLKKLAGDTLKHLMTFLSKVGSIILLSSIVIWMLLSFSTEFEYLGADGDIKRSILAWISGALYPLFKPLGFSSSFVVVAILTGIVGKEMVVSTIGIINGVEALGVSLSESLTMATSPINFTFASAVSFVLFVLLYPPCESAIAATKKEFGSNFAFKSVGFGFLVAYFVSLIGYHIASYSKFLIFVCLCVLLAIIVGLVIQFKKRESKKSCEVCGDCNRLCGRTKKVK